MEIQYTVTGVSKNFNPPPAVPGQPVSNAATYNVTLQLTNSPQFMGMSQFTIQVDAAQLVKYPIEAVGTITVNDPTVAHSAPPAAPPASPARTSTPA